MRPVGGGARFFADSYLWNQGPRPGRVGSVLVQAGDRGGCPGDRSEHRLIVAAADGHDVGADGHPRVGSTSNISPWRGPFWSRSLAFSAARSWDLATFKKSYSLGAFLRRQTRRDAATSDDSDPRPGNLGPKRLHGRVDPIARDRRFADGCLGVTVRPARAVIPNVAAKPPTTRSGSRTGANSTSHAPARNWGNTPSSSARLSSARIRAGPAAAPLRAVASNTMASGICFHVFTPLRT